MRKLLLLFGAVLCCLSSYASITLTANVNQTSSGSTITVTASGETQNSFIIGMNGGPISISTYPSQTYAANVTASIPAAPTYYNGGVGSATTFQLTVANYNPVTVSAVFYMYENVQTNNVASYVSIPVAVQITAGTFCNVQESGTFTRNNCGSCSTGSSVTYTVAANAYCSTTSQIAANQLAINDVNANGQAYANAHGTCSTAYWNVAESGAFTRNNCGSCSTGSSVTYTVAAHTYCSATSQSAADNQAITDVNTNGQTYANSHGTCTASSPVTITSMSINGTGVGSTAYLTIGGTYTLTVNYTGGPLTAYSFTKHVQSINITNTTNTSGSGSSGTATCTFYYTNWDSPPSPLIMSFTNSCGTLNNTVNIYPK